MNSTNVLTAERWKLIESIFHEASGWPEPERTALVKRLCGDDHELFEEVSAMLAALDTQGAELAGDLRGETEAPMVHSLAGQRFGNYRLDQLIGQGGMSSVYLAHRADGQFDRKVAVKLMSAHLASEFFTERFRLERQILADLDHPNITRLLDGGVGENGSPYLVMEYVDGLPLNEFCDRLRLDLRARIRLFVRICAAVQYAHERQIIHRDLKPGNVLVTYDNVPKLLDFGTAKLLAREKGDSTTTRFVFMTLRYASPEQLAGLPLSAATDVYSLGVMLYELATGAWPFGDPQSILAGLDRAVNDVKPGKAAQAVTEAAAEMRATSRATLSTQLRGDVEQILERALEAKPENRYGSVAEFAADLERFLEGKRASGASGWKRHRRVAIATVVAICCLATAYVSWRWERGGSESRSIVVLPFAHQASNADGQEFAEGLTADVRDELGRNPQLRVIAGASSGSFGGERDLTKIGRRLNVGLVVTGGVEGTRDRLNVSVALERTRDGARVWAKTYETQAANLASVESEVVSTLTSKLGASGDVSTPHVPSAAAYDAVLRGRFAYQQQTMESMAEAEREFRRAIELDPQYASAYVALGNVEQSLSVTRGSGYQTESERRNAMEAFRKALSIDPSLSTPHAMLGLFAMQYDWDWNRAERELRLGMKGSSASAERFYAFFLIYHGRFAEAEGHLRRMMDLDPLSSASMSGLALARNLEGRFAEAREIMERIARQNPKILAAKEMICQTYVEEGQIDKALPLIRELEKEFPEGAFLEAMARAKAGQRDEAIRVLGELERKYPNTAAMQWVALTYALLGDEPNTVKWLERSADRHEFQALNVAIHPLYAGMEQSPGFVALKKRMGLGR